MPSISKNEAHRQSAANSSLPAMESDRHLRGSLYRNQDDAEAVEQIEEERSRSGSGDWHNNKSRKKKQKVSLILLACPTYGSCAGSLTCRRVSVM